MSSHLKKTFTLLSILALGSLAAKAEPTLAPFQPEARYAAVGDSITHNGLYVFYTHLFYLTRFPQQNIEALNIGLSGDNSQGCLKRFEWDVAPAHATVASVMFGMNDVNRDLYTPGKVMNNLEQERQKCIAGYESNLRAIVKKLQEQKTQIILLSPSIFDETATMSCPNAPGMNVALEECTKRAQVMGAQLNIPVVDFYHPMRRINEQEQVKNPAFTLIGSDRVHPQRPGHLVMAYLFLKAQHVPAEVATVSVDAAQGRVAQASNCTVDQVEKTPGGLKLRYSARALPFPVEERAQPALNWVPFTDDLNRERFQITGLPAGSYRLEMDGQAIRNYTAEELAKGVNLATEPATPEAKQAQQVFALLKQRWDIVTKLRDIVFVEFKTARDLPRPLTLEQVQPLIEANLKAVAGKPSEGYHRQTSDAYLKNKPQQAELTAQAQAMTLKIREAAQPRPHQVAVTLIQP